MNNPLMVALIIEGVMIVVMLVALFWLVRTQLKLKHDYQVLNDIVHGNSNDIAGLCSAALTVDSRIATVDSRIAATDGQIDIMYSGGDIGTQTGMMLSPALWRKHIKPYSTQLIRPFKEAGCKTFYHSCGSIVPVIPDLIEMGLDILDPIQPKAYGMDPATLKEQFGDRLSFHGGVDVQELLPFGTPAQVAAEVTRVIDTLGANGGYIVSSAHALQSDTPVENALALFKTAQEHRY